MALNSLLKAISPFEQIPTRSLTGRIGLFALCLTVATSLVHCWMNTFGVMMTIKMNAIHLGTLMAVTFLLYPAFPGSPRERPSIPDWILAGLSL